MKIAIYSRKSKFTGKGESIENQIELCKEYAKNHFNIEEFIIYEDEGFSGSTADRPQFQLMLKDATKNKFNVLICYRLDRVSRNIADFAWLIEELQEYNINFISIKEQFDTSSPMGRAMMYIASVFAQLERETIAERIRDNMLQLAKTGRWLGGVTPTGFTSSEVTYTDANSKQRKMFKLTEIDDELEIVKLIYNKFLEFKSLTKLETYCISNNIKTKNNVDFSRFTLKNILVNPVYATADKVMYDYLRENDFEIYAPEKDFNGINGIMTYNKTIQKNNGVNRVRKTSQWIISVGAHKGVIESRRWIKVQKIINENKSKTFRKVRSSQSLLSGVLKCGKCGSFMRPKAGRINKNGVRSFYYICEMKEKSKKQRCDIKNINGNKIDALIIEEIKKLSSFSSDLSAIINNNRIGRIETTSNSIFSHIEFLEKQISSNETAIRNLINTLSHSKNTSATKYIVDQINLLDQQTIEVKEKLLQFEEKINNNQLKQENLKAIKNMLMNFSDIIDSLDVLEKRGLIGSLVDGIIWDGKSVDVNIFSKN